MNININNTLSQVLNSAKKYRNRFNNCSVNNYNILKVVQPPKYQLFLIKLVLNQFVYDGKSEISLQKLKFYTSLPSKTIQNLLYYLHKNKEITLVKQYGFKKAKY